MDGWWSYRPSDFVLFSATSWWRMVEAANAAAWPMQIPALAGGVAVLGIALRRRPSLARAAWLVLAAAWAAVAWFFHATHHATIDWSAPVYAWAFAAEAALLAACGIGCRDWLAASGFRRTLGLGLLAAAVGVYPLLALVAGRPWPVQAETFGLLPDPTALATVGLLLALAPRRRTLAALLWPIPLIALAVSAIQHATMRG
jgi:hypothetical protein